MVKKTACYSRELEFGSRYARDSSQLPINAHPRDLTPSSDLYVYCTHVIHTYTCRQDTNTNKMKIIKISRNKPNQEGKRPPTMKTLNLKKETDEHIMCWKDLCTHRLAGLILIK